LNFFCQGLALINGTQLITSLGAEGECTADFKLLKFALVVSLLCVSQIIRTLSVFLGICRAIGHFTVVC